ncbi:MAG: calcium-binding protein [Alphaproteobacteria bacterium]|nr:MAG: calcium-binding protein [Alphaproteobacteria bacterium]
MALKATTAAMLATAAVLAAGTAAAEKPVRGPLARFAAIDSNGDGAISFEELKGYREAQFAAADLDGDGQITRDELVEVMRARIEARLRARAQAMAEKQADRMLQRADRDGSGTLTADERGLGRLDRMFRRFDKDGDGQISMAEADAARQRWEARRAKRR